MASASTEEFLIPNACGSMIPSLEEILDFVGNNLAENVDSGKVLFKVKIIVTELLNNALKHVKNSKTFIQIKMDDENIQIIKRDRGTKLVINDLHLCQKRPSGSKYELSRDSLYALYAIMENDCRIKFICEETNTDCQIDFENLSEHFGLLIITKTANEFVYNYDPETYLNTFDVSISLAS